MNCLNGEKYLREAIDSVYAQTYKDWEIIFWDNASTDSSADIAKSYDEKLRYFRSEETVPLGKARNWAIEQARGEYIAFLDCDDIWLPEKLEKQINILESKPCIDLVYSNYFRMIMSKNNKLVLGLKRNQPDGHIFRQMLRQYTVNMQTVIIRKTALTSIGTLFDENLNLSAEYDLFMRILFKSKAAYSKEPLAIYRIHKDMSSIKFKSGFAKEILYIVDKFKQLEPSFNKKYHSELKYLNALIAYLKADTAIKNGNLREARTYLHPYKLVNYKYFILYFAIYLPGAWRALHDFRNKVHILLNS
ncbi:glycosyl transferase group 2 family protein [Dissulfurispira thermophila]|uniref:Glycosyl transferase group 2 family protein n=2 Tax=root TaxID=1 RepID=A0A7G1H0I8_9BACT|nr:glycosyl transferase group 2 family protein [Dissulfurispira thermophila]